MKIFLFYLKVNCDKIHILQMKEINLTSTFYVDGILIAMVDYVIFKDFAALAAGFRFIFLVLHKFPKINQKSQ